MRGIAAVLPMKIQILAQRVNESLQKTPPYVFNRLFYEIDF